MGRYYAQHDGEPAAVADGDRAALLAALCGRRAARRRRRASRRARRQARDARRDCSASASMPTGDKDPFGLRRARARRDPHPGRAAARRVPLRELVDARVRRVRRRSGREATRATALESFVYDRLRGYLRDAGYTAQPGRGRRRRSGPTRHRPRAGAARGGARVRRVARGRSARRGEQADRQHPAEVGSRGGRGGRPQRGSRTAPSTTSGSRSRSSSLRSTPTARRGDFAARAAGAGDARSPQSTASSTTCS